MGDSRVLVDAGGAGGGVIVIEGKGDAADAEEGFLYVDTEDDDTSWVIVQEEATATAAVVTGEDYAYDSTVAGSSLLNYRGVHDAASDAELQTGQNVTRIATMFDGNSGSIRIWDNPSTQAFSSLFPTTTDYALWIGSSGNAGTSLDQDFVRCRAEL